MTTGVSLDNGCVRRGGAGKEEVWKSGLPHGVQVEHGRLQLGQLDGGDAHGPDVAQLVVAAVLLHRRNFWSHPEERKQ